MNLTKEIQKRKLNTEPKLRDLNNRIEICDVEISVEITDPFEVSDNSIFEKFLSSYEFPKNSELSKKDRDSLEQALFPPILTLTGKKNFRPLVACYLFNVFALKGNTDLNIRSITKYELMWAEYILQSKNDRRVNVKRISTNGIIGAISDDYWFAYKTKDSPSEILSRIRILNMEINDYVLTFYIVDDEQQSLSQTDLEKFISGIKLMATIYKNNA